ncbi:MAG: hypothetical protein IPJ41_09570 [Phycisphaerales bacterium]|nr:hypothetical protein [Phycisphaerales bacterium]
MRPVSAVILSLALSAVASAQSVDDDRFREIEAGFEDLSPNAVSNRFMPVDLRAPTGFDRLYELVDAPGLLARRAGAITAVFDRSVYAGDATPLVPPGTVFYVGSLPIRLGEPGVLTPRQRPLAPGSKWNQEQAGSASPVPADLAVQPLDLRVRPDSPTGAAAQTVAGSMWSDEIYRQRRLGELLRRAEWTMREVQTRSVREEASSSSESPSPARGGPDR